MILLQEVGYYEAASLASQQPELEEEWVSLGWSARSPEGEKLFSAVRRETVKTWLEERGYKDIDGFHFEQIEQKDQQT